MEALLCGSIAGLVVIAFVIAIVLQYLTIRSYQRFILSERNPIAFRESSMTAPEKRKIAKKAEIDNDKRSNRNEFNAMIMRGVAPKGAEKMFDMVEDVIQ